MIMLDEDRIAHLGLLFDGVSDRDLIHELVRRGRLLQFKRSKMFWREMATDDRYVESVRRDAAHALMRDMFESDRNPVVTKVRQSELDGRANVVTHDVVVLAARGKSED